MLLLCAATRCSEDLPAAFTEEAATAKKGKGKVAGKGGKHGNGGKGGASGSGDAAALEADFAAEKPKRKKKGDDDGPVETMSLEQRLAKEHVAALVHAGASPTPLPTDLRTAQCVGRAVYVSQSV